MLMFYKGCKQKFQGVEWGKSTHSVVENETDAAFRPKPLSIKLLISQVFELLLRLLRLLTEVRVELWHIAELLGRSNSRSVDECANTGSILIDVVDFFKARTKHQMQLPFLNHRMGNPNGEPVWYARCYLNFKYPLSTLENM